jgi:hypothetical protein
LSTPLVRTWNIEKPLRRLAFLTLWDNWNNWNKEKQK